MNIKKIKDADLKQILEYQKIKDVTYKRSLNIKKIKYVYLQKIHEYQEYQVCRPSLYP